MRYAAATALHRILALKIEQLRKAARKGIDPPKAISKIDGWIGISAADGKPSGHCVSVNGMGDKCDRVASFRSSKTGWKVCIECFREAFHLELEAAQDHWAKTVEAKRRSDQGFVRCDPCDGGGLIFEKSTKLNTKMCPRCSGSGLCKVSV